MKRFKNKLSFGTMESVVFFWRPIGVFCVWLNHNNIIYTVQTFELHFLILFELELVNANFFQKM